VQAWALYLRCGANGAGKSTTIGITFVTGEQISGLGKVKGSEHDLGYRSAAGKNPLYRRGGPRSSLQPVFEKTMDYFWSNQAGYYGYRAVVTAKVRAERYLKRLGLWDKRNEPSRMLSGGIEGAG